MSNALDQDQDKHFVGPDLGPSCLQRSSADDKSPLAKKELKACKQDQSLPLLIRNRADEDWKDCVSVLVLDGRDEWVYCLGGVSVGI